MSMRVNGNYMQCFEHNLFWLIAPHIGHLYSSVIADAIFRFEKLLGHHSTYNFSTGTDEHGSKIQQAAQKNNTPVQEYCDQISNEYKTLFRNFNVDYTDIIRTTESRHHNAVEQFWVSLLLNKVAFCICFIWPSNVKKMKSWNCMTMERYTKLNIPVGTVHRTKRFSPSHIWKKLMERNYRSNLVTPSSGRKRKITCFSYRSTKRK